jgi:hypothetical protein
MTLALEARETDLLEVGPRSRLLLVDFNVAVRSIAGFFRWCNTSCRIEIDKCLFQTDGLVERRQVYVFRNDDNEKAAGSYIANMINTCHVGRAPRTGEGKTYLHCSTTSLKTGVGLGLP